jgi:hypothetical protein
MVKKEQLVGIGAFVALLCLMVVLYAVSKSPGLPAPSLPGGSYTQHGSSNYGSLPVQITDPSFLPKGTSAFWVTFSNASVYSQASGWEKGGGFGPVNLMAQTNQSVTISNVNVPYNSIISTSKLGVKYAFIVVNGTRYNVTLPGGYIMTNMSGVKFSSGKTLVVQLSPFVLSSAAASNGVVIGYSSRGYIVNGSGSYIGQSSRITLESAQSVTPYANVSIKSAAVSTVGGITDLKVTLVNHSNRTAHIGSVAVIGKENMTQNTGTIASLSSSYADSVVQKYVSSLPTSSGAATSNSGAGIGSVIVGALFNTSASGASAGINPAIYSKALGFGANLTSIVYANISALTQLAGPLPKSLVETGGSVNIAGLRSDVYQNIYNGLLNASISRSRFQSEIGSVGFTPSQDGSLDQAWNNENGSYYLQPNESVTLNYTGNIALDNTTSIGLVPDSGYQVVVSGDNGTSTSYDINSSS